LTSKDFGMTDPAKPYRQMARNNRLANFRLHSACAKLRPGEFEATRASFFPSIRATLNHIITIDWFYVDALEGGSLGPKAWEPEEPFSTLAPLTAAQAAVDDRILAICSGLTPEGLGEVAKMIRGGGRIQAETVGDVLLHLFLHDTHHRGQVHAMLAGTSVKPPQLDEFIVRDDARFRVEEMAALGWREGDLGK
jgi:uncharacterized damage-inducible protein DinB